MMLTQVMRQESERQTGTTGKSRVYLPEREGIMNSETIEKRINFTKVIYDVYANEQYTTRHFISFRKLNLTQAKRACRQRDDSFIPATVKLQHFTRVYQMPITKFIDHAKCVKTISNDTGKTPDQK